MSESSGSSSSGGGMGCVGCFLAAFLSIKTWGWTWWVVLHFICGWFYAAYWAVFLSGWIK
jgi:hypothetical protein